MTSPNNNTFMLGSTVSLEIRPSPAIDPASITTAQPAGVLSSVGPQKPQVTLILCYIAPRHSVQMLPQEAQKLTTEWSANIGALPFSMPIDSCYLEYEMDIAAQKLEGLDQAQIFGKYLYLFNVIVALEWAPSPSTIQQLRVAARRASDVLFDITDGYMAIGQVLIGGPDLMDVADIQVMASNRLHPRAWVDALNKPEKFQPIRVGRGLWRKNRGFVIAWDEPEGYRALVHEWGHYALGLADDYLDQVYLLRQRSNQRLWEEVARNIPATLQLVAPKIGLAVESIMSTLDASELIPSGAGTRQKRRDAMFKRLQQRFTELPANATIREGPSEVPIDLPVFRTPAAATVGDEEISLILDGTLQSLLPSLDPNYPGNSWVYLLKKGKNATDPPEQIIGQGVVVDIERPGDEIPLLGAARGDTVVVTGEFGGRIKIIRGTLGGKPLRVDRWEDVTPNVADVPYFVDVLPEPLERVVSASNKRPPATLGAARVQFDTSGRPPDEVRLYPFGRLAAYPGGLSAALQLQAPAAYPNNLPCQRYITDPVHLPHLDGHVLLRWDDGKLLICSYSHGGGPDTSGGGRLPISAGSAEGNAMVFFNENHTALEPGEPGQQDTKVRIVTTVIHWGDERIGEAEARSYVFSLASNADLTPYAAALVLYYDTKAPRHGGNLVIYRWADSDGWQPLTTYAPNNQSYVIVPWNLAARESAERLLLADTEFAAGPLAEVKPRFERYRIYWTP